MYDVVHIAGLERTLCSSDERIVMVGDGHHSLF